MNIAIVDDEKAELAVAESYLKDYLRENWLGNDVNIQTFSSAKDFLNVFKVGAFQLVILDIIMPEINGLQAAQIIRTRITLKVENAAVKVPFKNILYVEIDYRHRLCVYLAKGRKFVTNDNYSELAPILLADSRFLECYHRIIVNMDYIKAMESDDFILIDDTSIPISQRKKRDVKVKYMRYFADK